LTSTIAHGHAPIAMSRSASAVGSDPKNAGILAKR
jgi:hypothetical protein